jgi:hypothetical protein
MKWFKQWFKQASDRMDAIKALADDCADTSKYIGPEDYGARMTKLRELEEKGVWFNKA